MARRYSRRRGRSGSKKPLTQTKQAWLRYKPKEIEMIVVKLAKEGKNAAQIGVALRDIYGVPDVRQAVGKRMGAIIAEKNLTPKLPDDMVALIRRSLAIRKHLEENKKDMTAKRGMQLTDAKINALAKYYKGTGKVPLEWKYDPVTVKIYVE
ncbi:MAG: 30S ribosomal protein S15 [Nanoarchaeota archaeon]